jgi:predicted Na+-dependent transporter
VNDMVQISQVIANVGILTFVVASMAALGLSLTVGQIAQPLRNGRLVAMALLANFVLITALAFAIRLSFPWTRAMRSV